MECEPAPKTDVLYVALVIPLFVESAPVPTIVAPSLKVTAPVGIAGADPTGAIVAVTVTGSPNTEGFMLELTAVVVLAGSTVTATVIS